MSEAKTSRIVLILFLPAILNMAISWIIASIVVSRLIAEGVEPARFGIEIAKVLFTYNFYWSILQAAFGIYLAKAMGGIEWLREKYSLKNFEKTRSVLLIAGLVVVSLGLIFLEQFVNVFLYGGWENFSEWWREVIGGIPLWSKIYLAAIAPFTAGIFEEIIWRCYGIETLEKRLGPGKANLVQAIAFGFWHGISLHTLITFLIGYVYGLVYLKRRNLIELSIAHILTDIIGFSVWVFG